MVVQLVKKFTSDGTRKFVITLMKPIIGRDLERGESRPHFHTLFHTIHFSNIPQAMPTL